jgi:hypothetical protein
MKIILLHLIFLLSVLTYGQDSDENQNNINKGRIDNGFSAQIGVQGSAFLSLDNNFIKQAYAQDIGFNVEVRFGIKEFFGLGINFNRYEFSIDDFRFLGSRFPSSRFYSNSIFTYYQQPLFKRVTAEIKFGIFQGNILNRSETNSVLSFDNLRLNFSGLISGINLVYYLDSKKRIGISLGADIYFSLSDEIQTALSERNFINRNTFSTVNLGIVMGN